MNIKVTKYSMQFVMNNISFDLLPATNFVTEYPQPTDGSELAKIQANRTMEYIKRNPGFGYRYGSSVCEQQLEFLKNQTSFVHEVVRLAKFWNKTISMGGTYISGRSTMIELIGIHAGRTQEALGQRSHLEAFKKFLDMISKFDTLCVKFCHFYMEYEIPDYVKNQRPLVLDPVNMHNNFAYFIQTEKAGIIRKFKQFAGVTLSRLNHCTDLNGLFQVQPMIFVPGPQPGKWLLEWHPNDRNLVNPRMDVRMSDGEFKMKAGSVKEMQQCLLTTLAALTLDGKAVNVGEIWKGIQSCVDQNILSSSARQWTQAPSTDRFEDYNVTFWIPIPGIPNQCIVFSASW